MITLYHKISIINKFYIPSITQATFPLHLTHFPVKIITINFILNYLSAFIID